MKNALLKLYYGLPEHPKEKVYDAKDKMPVKDATYWLMSRIIPNHITCVWCDIDGVSSSIKFVSRECYEYMLDNIKECRKLLFATEEDLLNKEQIIKTVKDITRINTIVDGQHAIEVAELFE